jgi:hypothetical protein
VRQEAIRPARRSAWASGCAAILLAVLALSLLHAAAPHVTAQRHCATCLALSSPALAQAHGGLLRPDPPSEPLAADPADFLLLKNVRLLKPLRAPPSPPIV